MLLSTSQTATTLVGFSSSKTSFYTNPSKLYLFKTPQLIYQAEPVPLHWKEINKRDCASWWTFIYGVTFTLKVQFPV